jgi:putative membrane protein
LVLSSGACQDDGSNQQVFQAMTNANHLKVLERGVNVWNSWRKKKGSHLHSESDLRRMDVGGIDLSGVNLTKLTKAKLSEAILLKARAIPRIPTRVSRTIVLRIAAAPLKLASQTVAKGVSIGLEGGAVAARQVGSAAQRVTRSGLAMLPKFNRGNPTKKVATQNQRPQRAERVRPLIHADGLLASVVPWRWWALAGAALTLLAGLTFASWIMHLLEQGWVIGGAAIGAAVALVLGVSGALFADIRNLQQLREATRYQQDLVDDAAPETKKGQRQMLLSLVEELTITAEQRAELRKAIADASDESAAIDEVERRAVRDMDLLALSRVRTAVMHSFGLIALSPTSITDTALFIWRALRLVREVAYAYGLRPNRIGSLWLLRQVLSDVALLTAADLATDALGTILGDKLAARLSSPLAEGSLASYRMARFGLLAIQRCRPIAFRKDDQLGLSNILRVRR